MYYALIMAGGSGTRLWPLSRRLRPKQALKLVGERTMFQHAVDRLAPLFRPQEIFVVTKADYVTPLSAQAPDLPRTNFIVEPEGRGTAPAIGLAAVHLRHQDPEAVMAVLTADHYIVDTAAFRQALAAAQSLAQAGYLITLGVKPASPSTAYGYIQRAEALEGLSLPAYRVARFVEKPSREAAERLVAGGDHSWNAGMFIWRVDRILEELKRQMPAFFAQLCEVEDALGTSGYAATLGRLWPQVAEQTIDYGVMEGARNVAVLPVDIGWSDVGSWTSLFELLPVDSAGNAFTGPHLDLDTRDTLVVGGERLIATIGVDNLVIVDAGDALLICSRAREQDVRRVVSQLKSDGLNQWL